MNHPVEVRITHVPITISHSSFHARRDERCFSALLQLKELSRSHRLQSHNGGMKNQDAQSEYCFQ